jgi:hypothetical protein
MTTIADVRQKFPQYNDLSDQELADALHGKFYSDMSKEQFYKNIGLTSEQPKVEAPKKPSLLQSGLDAATAIANLTPANLAARKIGGALGKVGEMVDKAAYGAGGKVTDIASQYVSPEVAAGAGTATNIAIQAIPVVLGGEAAKIVGSPALKAVGKRFMQSALKPPSTSFVGGEKSEAVRAIKTMLEEGVNVTPQGAAKLRSMITKLNTEVKSIIANSTGVVDRQKVGAEILKKLDDVSKEIKPGASMKAVEEVFDEFMSHPLLKGDKIPVQLAQDMKTATQKVLSDDFGQLSNASKEAQKAGTRALRQGIEEVAPDVAKLNAKESELLNALLHAEHRAAIAGNTNPAGLGFLANNPAAFAAFLADRSSLFKSIVGRILYSGSRNIPGFLGSGATAVYEAQTQNP